MKMSGIVTWCCVALFFALTSVSAVQRLHSINDLLRINFGQSLPKHIVLLLYWFAKEVDIDNHNVIRLNFDPNSRAYGSHHYGNHEGLLDPLPRGHGYTYFTVGSLYQKKSMQLPNYVVYPRTEYKGNTSDRIIFRVRDQIIDQVYITQHIEDQAEYDRAHTYQITTYLLRQIREFTVRQNHQSLTQLRNHLGSNADVSNIIRTWGNLAGLGLLLFIVIQEGQSFYQHYTPQGYYRPEYDYRPENSNNFWGICVRVIGCILLVLVVVVGFLILLSEANRLQKGR
ncbi:uncharacterized protein LOC131982929 [Centropristis striata]|uniref:uncharacterized protein LOC131982929 n=1 Tax=Centropristis striata TaxID=184440 RepID=UPI0027E13F62|nr:uncharacterized protein LOC131982929 [Centropristis striata]